MKSRSRRVYIILLLLIPVTLTVLNWMGILQSPTSVHPGKAVYIEPILKKDLPNERSHSELSQKPTPAVRAATRTKFRNDPRHDYTNQMKPKKSEVEIPTLIPTQYSSGEVYRFDLEVFQEELPLKIKQKKVGLKGFQEEAVSDEQALDELSGIGG